MLPALVQWEVMGSMRGRDIALAVGLVIIVVLVVGLFGGGQMY